jgi:hypothetical protein
MSPPAATRPAKAAIAKHSSDNSTVASRRGKTALGLINNAIPAITASEDASSAAATVLR